ncbi:HupE-UreJ family metal transporter [Vibrio chagasii]|nr:HupE-UreJ family metal transporter [Vibrio chagasii]CAH6815732.1 HupE-UreJ family metal transporter [Vibrio chagasii]CAH7434041.1 HupE-UreJ family metal transporter [Vibrio chagasii]CAH7484873.1 HupE-UreJ family metal transporter [Vibrio chagasii]
MNFKYATGLTTLTIASLTTPTLVFAHPGHDHGSHSFLSGLTHPVTGVDHLIMLVAFGMLIGVLSYSNKVKSALVGGGLVSLMVGLLVGKVLGFSVVVEPAIIASLFAVSLCLWHVFSPSTTKVNTVLAVSIGFLFFHGYAHGVEAASGLAQFAAGMGITAFGLIVAGYFAGKALYSKWASVGVASLSALFLMAA